MLIEDQIEHLKTFLTDHIDNGNGLAASVNTYVVLELITMLQEVQKDLEDANALKAVIMDERTQWESAARSIVNALGESVVGLQSPDSVRDTGVAVVVALLKKKGNNND